MLYTELQIGSDVYKLRLNTRASMALEKALGYNPISLFMEIENGKMPRLTDIVIILHATLQPYHHGITMDKAADLFDDYVADGKSMIDIIPVFIEVFKQSGYISAATNEDADAKN